MSVSFRNHALAVLTSKCVTLFIKNVTFSRISFKPYHGHPISHRCVRDTKMTAERNRIRDRILGVHTRVLVVAPTGRRNRGWSSSFKKKKVIAPVALNKI